MKTKVGFAVHDAARDGRAFAIEEEAGEALVFGSAAAVRVDGRGVLPKHFVVLPHEGMLLAASASAQAPAYVDDAPLGGDWTLLQLPCRVRLGAAVIEFFVLPAEATEAIQHAHEIAPPPPGPVGYAGSFSGTEETRIGPLPQLPQGHAPHAPHAHAHEIAPPRAAATSEPSVQEVTARIGVKSDSVAVRAVCRLRDDYHRLSRPKRLLVPVAGLLAFLSLASPSQADEATAPPAPADVQPAKPGEPGLPGAPSISAPNALGLVAPGGLPSQLQLGAGAAASDLSGVTPADSRLGGTRPAVAPALGAPTPEGARGPVALPSARSLPAHEQVNLSGQERVVYHRAIEATLAGDFATAYRLYDQLSASHPEAGDIRAAQRVLAVKLKTSR